MEKLTIIEEGKPVEYDVLFTLKDEQKQKEFVIYTDLNDPNMDIFAALYDRASKKIDYIEDQNEQKMIAEIVNRIKGEATK